MPATTYICTYITENTACGLTCSCGAPEVCRPKAKGKTPTLLCCWREVPHSKYGVHMLSQCNCVNHMQRVSDGESIGVHHKHVYSLLQDVVDHEDTGHPHVSEPLVSTLHNGHIEQLSGQTGQMKKRQDIRS